jgi:hypothetical protein
MIVAVVAGIKGSTEDGYRTGITVIYPGSMNQFREMRARLEERILTSNI